MTKLEKLLRNIDKITAYGKTWVGATEWQNDMGIVRLCIADLGLIMITYAQGEEI